jgi:transcriptional regulator NrdR family protein
MPNCPKCDWQATTVQETQSSSRYTKRKVKCNLCGNHFKTIEISVADGKQSLLELMRIIAEATRNNQPPIQESSDDEKAEV